MKPISDINLSSSREEENHWRIPRLHRVLGYVCARAHADGNFEVLNRISGMEDWKGTLTVAWLIRPTQLEKQYFFEAWESEIGDCSPSEFVVHETLNGPIV